MNYTEYNTLREEIKIIPLVETIELLDISDEEYFSSKYSDYISNSRLSLINPDQDGSVKQYVEGFSGGSFSDAFYFGSAVHQMVLQPDDYYIEENTSRPTAKLGFMIDEIINYRKKGYSIYDSIINASNKVDYYKNKVSDKLIKETLIKKGFSYYWFRFKYNKSEKEPIFLNTQDQFKLKNCIKSVNENRAIQKVLNPDYIFDKPISINEGTLLMDIKAEYQGKEYIIKLKAKLDNFVIDFENETLYLNDLKTTGKFINKFNESFEKFHYARQMAMYFYMLRIYVDQKYNFTPKHFYGNMMLVSTILDNYSGVFKINKYHQKKGMDEFSYLLRLVIKHYYAERDLENLRL